LTEVCFGNQEVLDEKLKSVMLAEAIPSGRQASPRLSFCEEEGRSTSGRAPASYADL
jgi:hypothetical protein